MEVLSAGDGDGGLKSTSILQNRGATIAGKPDPTRISVVHKFCVRHRTCGSGLARDSDLSIAAIFSAWR
jgi:hypothetical protein